MKKGILVSVVALVLIIGAKNFLPAAPTPDRPFGAIASTTTIMPPAGLTGSFTSPIQVIMNGSDASPADSVKIYLYAYNPRAIVLNILKSDGSSVTPSSIQLSDNWTIYNIQSPTPKTNFNFNISLTDASQSITQVQRVPTLLPSDASPYQSPSGTVLYTDATGDIFAVLTVGDALLFTAKK